MLMLTVSDAGLCTHLAHAEVNPLCSMSFGGSNIRPESTGYGTVYFGEVSRAEIQLRTQDEVPAPCLR